MISTNGSKRIIVLTFFSENIYIQKLGGNMNSKSTNVLKFLILSTLGVVLYIFPFTINGESTIFISHFTNYVLGRQMVLLGLIIIFSQIVTLVGTTIGQIKKYKKSKFKSSYLNDLFITSNLQYFFRVFGVIFFMMTANFILNGDGGAGNFIVSEVTGQVMFGIILTLYCTFFIGIILMPLLTKFGAVEFVGTLVAPFMRKVFRVPGYAAIDATASFVGDGTIGIVVTDQQYQKGYYTQKEAALIATTFSIVGIAFAGAVAEELGFSEVFGAFYLAIIIVTILVAIIMARISLKKYKNEYYDKPADVVLKEKHEKISVKNAFESAVSQASKVNFATTFIDSLKSVSLIYVTLIPIIMFAGTLGLIVAEFTSIITYISIPFVPVFKLLGFSDQASIMMAPAMLVGFLDMYLPVVFATELTEIPAKFFIGIMTFSQLVFLSETGMVMLKTKIGFKFFDVVKIFLLRTVIAFPIILLITKLYMMIGII